MSIAHFFLFFSVSYMERKLPIIFWDVLDLQKEMRSRDIKWLSHIYIISMRTKTRPKIISSIHPIFDFIFPLIFLSLKYQINFILLLALSVHKQIILHPLSLVLRAVHPYDSILRVIFVVNIWKVTDLNISFPVITSLVSANIFTFYLFIVKYSYNTTTSSSNFLIQIPV